MLMKFSSSKSVETYETAINITQDKIDNVTDDPNDIAHFDGFPKNYTDYIERLDFAVLAYFNGDLSLVSDERFELMEESLKGV